MTSSVSTLGSAQITSQIQQYTARLDAPITALQGETTADNAQISAWGAISGSISSLSSALSGIKDLSTLNNRSATSSTTTVATASAAINSETGTFNLSNVVLAKSQELYSAIQASAGATLSGGAGSLTFTLKSGKTENVSLGSGSLTLTDIAKAVNATSGPVQASVISTSAGARLVFTGSGTGSSQAFSVAGTGALSRFAYSSATPGTEVVAQKAQDANLSLNGVPVTSATNTLSSAISGVTIKLAGSGNTTVSVSSSPSTLSTALNSVATDLNSAISTILKETKYVPPSSASATKSSSAPKSGPLLGNYSANDLSNQLMSAVSGAAASGMSANSIGLKISSNGTVSFDSSTFATAYAQNPSAVQTLIGKIYTSLSGVTAGAIGSASGTANSGTIGAATTSLKDTVTSIDSQVTVMSKSASEQIQQLVNAYTVAESAQTTASLDQQYLGIFLGSASNSSG